jgi:hypothetical protein
VPQNSLNKKIISGLFRDRTPSIEIYVGAPNWSFTYIVARGFRTLCSYTVMTYLEGEPLPLPSHIDTQKHSAPMQPRSIKFNMYSIRVSVRPIG